VAEERKLKNDRWISIEGCKNPKAFSIFARANSQRVVDEVERSNHEALMVVKKVVQYPYIVVKSGRCIRGKNVRSVQIRRI
jgi:chaperonin GroEL (HSP60 family)